MVSLDIYIDDEKYDYIISQIEKKYNTSKSKARQILISNINDLVGQHKFI